MSSLLTHCRKVNRQAGTGEKGVVKEEKLQKNDTGTLADTGIDL